MTLQIIPRDNGFIVRTPDGVEIVAADGSPFTLAMAEAVARAIARECQRRLVARN